MFDFVKSLFSQAGQVDLAKIIKEGALLVDVRTPQEFADGSVRGAINIPLDQVNNQSAKFQGHKNIILFCRSGNRSGQAKSILEQKGIANVYNGGTWRQVNELIG